MNGPTSLRAAAGSTRLTEIRSIRRALGSITISIAGVESLRLHTGSAASIQLMALQNCNFAASIDPRGARDFAHAPALVVAKGLHQLLLCIHHERPIVSHRLADRHSRQEQQSSRLASLNRSAQPHRITRSEDCQLTIAYHGRPIA